MRTIIIALLFLFVASTANAALISHWRMDEPIWSGTTPNAVLDSVGTNHGTAYAGVTTVVGHEQRAGNFDGSDDYVKVTGDVIGTGAISIEVWVYLKGWGGNGYGRIVDNSQCLLFAYGSSENIRLSSNAGVTAAATGTLVLNQWYHIVGVRKSGGLGTLYVNGVLSRTADQNTGTPAAGSDTYIGNISTADRGFNGKIDEVRLYNTALTATEVAQLYWESSHTRIKHTTLKHVTLK